MASIQVAVKSPSPPPAFSFKGDLDLLLGAVGYAYALRVPVLLFLVAAFVTFGGLDPTGPGAPILRGIYDAGLSAEGPAINIARFALLTFTTLVFAATITVTAWIIATLGHLRIGPPHPGIPDTRGTRLVCVLPNLALALIIIAGCSARSGRPSWALLGDLAGITLFGLFFLAIRTLSGSSAKIPFGSVFRVLIAAVAGFSKRDIASSLFAIGMVLSIAIAWIPFSKLIPGDKAGYFDMRSNPPRLFGRQRFAVAFTSASFAAYLTMWFLKDNPFNLTPSSFPLFPTLALVLLLGILICWVFAGATFFLDRYRVPLIFPIVLYSTFASSFPQADHFYRAVPVSTPNLPWTPRAALKAAAGQPVVVVAATGGGIQAAAWSARVLRQLQFAAQNEKSDFANSIRLISAVSGGSVGTMYFANAYDPFKVRSGTCSTRVTDIDNDCVIGAAEASSLDEVASGLVYEDTTLGLVPFLKGIDYDPRNSAHGLRLENGRGLMLDRGNALENAFKRVPGVERPLLAWKKDTREGTHHRPAVIFNATIVENGERLLFSTTDLDDSTQCAHWGSPGFARQLYSDALRNGRVDFHRLYCVSDVTVATAVRLSATFPYVSPAARILEGDLHWPSNHIVDGGYTDNYGTASVVEWLDKAMTKSDGEKDTDAEVTSNTPVLVLEIRSSPAKDGGPPPGDRGFLFQSLHPITTLLNVRDTAQLSNDQTELRLLEGQLRNRRVCSALFSYIPPPDQRTSEPLSWHLTESDKANLKTAWQQQSPAEINKVLRFLKYGSCAK